MTPTDPPPAADERSNDGNANPFVGPRPLGVGDRLIGREAEARELFYQLSAERVLLLTGPAGCGKTSIIQAGLLPVLQREQFDAWPTIRPGTSPPGVEPSSAESDPQRYLRNTKGWLESELPDAKRRPIAEIEAQSLVDYIANRPRRRAAPPNVVLIFDPIGDLLSLDPHTAAANRFLLELRGALANPRVWALFCIRDESLAQIEPVLEQLPESFGRRLGLQPFTRTIAERVIVESSVDSPRAFDAQAASVIADDLCRVNEQHADGTFHTRAGATIEPLHLQLVCREIWRRGTDGQAIQIERSTVGATADAILAQYYNDRVAQACAGDKERERQLRHWFSNELISSRNTRDQVLKQPHTDSQPPHATIRRLHDDQLLIANRSLGATWFAIRHDRLLGPIRSANQGWLQLTAP